MARGVNVIPSLAEHALVCWDEAAELVSLCLSSRSRRKADLIRHSLCRAPSSCVPLESPSVELSPHPDRIYADPRLNTQMEMKAGSFATYDSPSLMRISHNLAAEGLRRQRASASLYSI
ncbi:unnamed protein product [Pleuronectes platessa]|uniref:Uncharacterized protein n=1 Tax=Pleuronectes platessa TaxID=8262 RepID=A0A9N7YN50_PLEPL|nr:unnamed protein product [Pleuronectes platessa]